MNAAAALLAAGEPGRHALACEGRALGYGDLAERVARVAGGLRALGIAPGERVLLAAADGFDWVAAHLGAIWAGAVSVPLNPRLSPEVLAHVAAESDARLLVCERRHELDLAQAAVQDLAQAPGIEPHPVAGEAAAFWVYSSGSTARPKAVIHAHRAIGGCAAFAREVLALGPDDRLFSTSRLTFAYPLANSLYAGLSLGARVLLDPRWPDAKSSVDAALTGAASVMFSVPTLYRAMLDSGQAARLRKSALRWVVSAGESLPAALAERWQRETGVAMIGGYGMSETLALVLYRREPDEAFARPAPLAEVRAEPAVSDGAPQRLWFRHPSVALGYCRRPELQAANFRDGWCSAGDLFHQPVPGGWLFAGREDDWVKIAGRWVGVVEVETAISRQCGPLVKELALAAVDDADGLCALAAFASADAASAPEVLAAAIAQLPKHQRPRWVHWLPALPRTTTGKLGRAELLALHRDSLKTASAKGEG